MARLEWSNNWGAVVDLTTPGVVKLTLDGIEATGATPEEARAILAERIRDRVVEQWPDPSTSPFADPTYRVWGFIRQPIARFRRKIVDYTAYRATLTDPVAIAEVDRKLAGFSARLAILDPQERTP